MRNFFRALRGKPVELSPQQQEKLARQRAKADRMIAEREAEAREAMAEAAKYMPGGVHHAGANVSTGPATESQPPPMPELPTEMPDLRGMLKQSWENARDAFGEMFDDRAGIIDPGPGADMNRPPAEVEDPDERARIAEQERAARAAARQPYAAPAAQPVEFTRFATSGEAQLNAVAEHLRTMDPERVFGVYRFPDRFDHGRNAEKKTYMEWEIAHAPGAAAPTAAEVQTVAFRRDAWLVRRRPGEPSVVDEDVTGTLCGRAGLRPEDTFGLTRFLHVRGRSSEQGTNWYADVEGALVFARRSPALQAAYERVLDESPMALAAKPALPFHLEILDWEAVAAWVAPDRWGPPRAPSPLPHLPSDPRELIQAYLEVVGVRSEDCFGVQVTRTTEKGLADLSLASAKKNFRAPPKLPCADGKDRARLHAAEHVVIAYRDRAGYGDGRARWRAYQDEVLHATLDHLTGERPPIEVDDHPRQSFLSEVFDMFNPLDPVPTFPQLFNRNQKPSLGPYCGWLD